MSSNPPPPSFDPDEPYYVVATDFFAAVGRGDAPLVKEMLGHFPDLVAHEYPSNGTVLLLAARKGHIDVARMLVEAGADITKTDAAQMTPLCYAAYYGHRDVCDLLLQSGADPEEKGDCRADAIAFANAGDFPSLSEYLKGEAGRRREAEIRAWSERPADMRIAKPLQPMKPLKLKGPR